MHCTPYQVNLKYCVLHSFLSSQSQVLMDLCVGFAVTVRMFALPLVWNRPSNLTEEMNSSLLQLESVVKSPPMHDITSDDMSHLLRCAVFHSVLLHRQTYRPFGQGTIYKW